MKKIVKYIISGPPDNTPTGNYLQMAFWSLVRDLKISPSEWNTLMQQYIKNDIYSKDTTATPDERIVRLTNALTGGSDLCKPDFTWKRFIEGLVVLDVKGLTLTISAKRGNWNTSGISIAGCIPSNDLIRTLEKTDNEDVVESVTTTLSRYLKDPKHTAERIMDHILLKSFWSLVSCYKIDITLWNKLLYNYVNNPKNCPQLANRKNDKRHNLQQRLRQTKKLSWQKYLESLKAIDVRNAIITFKFDIKPGVWYEHSFELNIQDLDFRGEYDE